MTVNYQETQISGSKWRRCNTVLITNPLQGQAVITLQEETVMTASGTKPVVVDRTTFRELFDPEAVIQLRNPLTDEPLDATITQAEVYAILYSLYRQMAEKKPAK